MKSYLISSTEYEANVPDRFIMDENGNYYGVMPHSYAKFHEFPKSIDFWMNAHCSDEDRFFTIKSEALIPAKFVFGQDYEVQKSEAWWIAAWILERKELQYSTKKQARFTDEGYRLPDITVEHHEPRRMTPVKDNTINELKR